MALSGEGNPFEGDPGNPFQDPAVIQHRPTSEYATLDVYNPFDKPGQPAPPYEPPASAPTAPPVTPAPVLQPAKKLSPTEPRNYGSYGTQDSAAAATAELLKRQEELNRKAEELDRRERELQNAALGGGADLQNQVFVFPVESDSAAVVLKTTIPHPLTSFTVCLWHYTLLTRKFILFSYATPTTDNDIFLFKPKPNEYTVYVGNALTTFSLPEQQHGKPAWEHLCASWESATGLVSLWVNGKLLPRAGLQKGYSISNDASIVLGQDQDSILGGYEANESFVGEMREVSMWNRVLTPAEVCLAFSGCNLSDYLINWRALRYEIQGYVLVQPYLTSCPR